MQRKQKGSITLETSIIVPIFILIFLLIDGLFVIVSARNEITHALIQSANSLALDSYLTENVESAGETGTKFWADLSDMVIDINRIKNDTHFTSQTDWYKSPDGKPQIVKSRFVGYLAGGDEAVAEETLKSLGVINGLSGVSFKTSIDDEDVEITIQYQLQFWFDFFGLGKIPVKQSITTRMWM